MRAPNVVSRLLIGLMILSIAMTTGVLGCKTEEQPSELRVAASDDISNLDPAMLSIAVDRSVAENIYNGLTQFNLKTFEVEPALAESWDISPDGKTYTFHLRQGVMFHKDYGEMTSEDVAFSFMRHKDPAVKSREAGTFAVVESVDTPDEYTAVVNLASPCPALPYLLAWQCGFICSKKAVEELGEDFTLHPIGTGPYYFDTWVQAEKLVLTAFDDCWKGRPEVDQVTIRVIPDETIAVDAIARDELDLVALFQVAAYRAAKENPNVKVFTGKSGEVNYLYLQTQYPPTDKLEVRQAIAYALDLGAMREAFDGMLVKNDTFLNPLCVGFKEVYDYPYDLEKAKALIAQADLPDDAKLVIYYRKSHLYEHIALMVKDQLEKIIPCELVLLDASVQASKFAEGQFNVGVWAMCRLESDLYFSQRFLSTAGANYSQWRRADVDALINEARAELDPVRRAELYVELQELCAEDLPILSTGLLASVVVANQRVQDVWPHPYPGLISFETVVLEGE